MMNSTMKIVRGKIEHHYKELLNFLYTPEAKNIICKRNIEAVKNILGELL
jgi:long-chain acyl-CoA synthetase